MAIQTVQVELPKGVDPKKVGDIIRKYTERGAHTKAYNKSRRKALNELAKMFPKEFKALCVKHGIKPQDK